MMEGDTGLPSKGGLLWEQQFRGSITKNGFLKVSLKFTSLIRHSTRVEAIWITLTDLPVNAVLHAAKLPFLGLRIH